MRGGSSTFASTRRVASMPSTPGMRMSITITSGRRRRTSGATSAPSPASPSTVRSGSASTIARRPVRISGSSSTSSTPRHRRTIRAAAERRHRGSLRASLADAPAAAPRQPEHAVVAPGRHAAAQRRDALLDAREPAPAAGPRAPDRVAELELQPVLTHVDLQPRRPAGVAGGVRQALLDDAVRLAGHRPRARDPGRRRRRRPRPRSRAAGPGRAVSAPARAASRRAAARARGRGRAGPRGRRPRCAAAPRARTRGSESSTRSAAAAWIETTPSACPTESCSSRATRLRSARIAICSAGDGPSSAGASRASSAPTPAATYTSPISASGNVESEYSVAPLTTPPASRWT